MDEKPIGEIESYVEFDSASMRTAPKVYGGVFQLNYNDDEAVLTFGHKGAALPAESGELDGKNFAEVVVFITPRTAEELMHAMREMIDFWDRADVAADSASIAASSSLGQETSER